MSESDTALSEIMKLRAEVDQQGEMLDAMVQYDPDVQQGVLDEFKKDKVLVMVYLLVDGQRNQKAIVQELKNKGETGASAPMVTRKIQHLAGHMKLITPLQRVGGSWVYVHSRLGRALRLEKKLRKLEGGNV